MICLTWIPGQAGNDIKEERPGMTEREGDGKGRKEVDIGA